MDWIIGVIAGTSPLWCAYLASKKPDWTSGSEAIVVYGFLIGMLFLYVGMQSSDKDHQRSFRDHCEERAPDVYLCDFRTYQGREPVGEGTGQRYNE